ncbi:MAG: hypothetical protein GW878_02650, partial [Acidobacteria bacterium]|nr:hypothetical protein [Acidobacteriota bacterium]
MRKSILILSLVTMFIGAAAFIVAADTAAAKPQTTCPVTGNPIDKAVHIDFQGQRIYFCCTQ